MATANPPWTREELILALDLYFRLGYPDAASTVRHSNGEIVALSRLLNKSSIHPSQAYAKPFRNSHGVYMKLGNFLGLDPRYGKKGLQSRSKEDIRVWDEFSSDPKRLGEVADAIRATIQTHGRFEVITEDELIDGEGEAPEGRVLFKQHLVRERNRKLIEKKKKLMLSQHGDLKCEVCSFSFGEHYGELGKGFIECHHIKPLFTLRPNQSTRIQDLAIVCANCHRMLHRGVQWPSLFHLRQIVR